MTSIFDPLLPDSYFMVDAEFECGICHHFFVLGELRFGDADEEVEDCRSCGADRAEVQRI